MRNRGRRKERRERNRESFLLSARFLSEYSGLPRGKKFDVSLSGESAGADCSENLLLFLRRRNAEGGREGSKAEVNLHLRVCLTALYPEQPREILRAAPRTNARGFRLVTFLLSYSRGEVKFRVAGTFSTSFSGGVGRGYVCFSVTPCWLRSRDSRLDRRNGRSV